MERAWTKNLPIPLAIAGGLCLAAMVVVCLLLDRGGPFGRIGVACAMLALAALALLLLK